MAGERLPSGGRPLGATREPRRFIGQRDRTAIGKDLAPPEVAKKLGDYPVLGKRAAQAIPGARLVEFADLGHSPQVEDPARFNAALLQALAPR